MVQETWVQSQVVSYQRLEKWYLIQPCLTLSNIRYVSRVKWSNQGKGVAPSPTSCYSSYWQRSQTLLTYTFITDTTTTGARGVVVIVVGNGHGDTSSNPGPDWLHFSHSTNTLGKGMNPIILPPAMGKIVGETRFFSHSLGEGKLWIQTC